ncbi:hypothetical protein ACRABS_003557, partial [Salmonella enterica subsp. enterica]
GTHQNAQNETRKVRNSKLIDRGNHPEPLRLLDLRGTHKDGTQRGTQQNAYYFVFILRSAGADPHFQAKKS